MLHFNVVFLTKLPLTPFLIFFLNISKINVSLLILTIDFSYFAFADDTLLF